MFSSLFSWLVWYISVLMIFIGSLSGLMMLLSGMFSKIFSSENMLVMKVWFSFF